MKTQFIADLRDGDMVNDYFLATRKDLRTQTNGGKFLGMVFRDRTGEIGGILWNNAESISNLFNAGDIVNVRGQVTSYQSRLQIRVESVLPLREHEYRQEDLVAMPQDTTDQLNQFKKLLGTIENKWLAQLVGLFLEDGDLMARFMGAAAGKKWHHAYPGGLVRHCNEIARLAMAACDVFPELDRDLLLAVVFLHDIGKLDEMSHELFVDYTDAGKLIGHLEIGVEMVRSRIARIEGFPELLRLHLLHCILSHHGELVNGSPVLPKTPEAFVLYHCDNLDAQVDAAFRIIEETRERRKDWSDFQPLINREIWNRPKE